jgi:hypothetical protein
VGIALGQAVLYGPSLTGHKILLPLDILGQPEMYLPRTPDTSRPARDMVLSDLVLQFEPDRRFAIRELQAGRFPLWNPNQYAGVPFIWPKFSPFQLLGCMTLSPVILAWTQFAVALVAAGGMFLFARKVLGVGFWPAAVVAWCYPLTAFFVFWLGYPTCGSVYWLPWLLWAVDRTVQRAGVTAPLGLAIMTALVLVSGHIDVAGQVLLISGLFGIWSILRVAEVSTKRSRPLIVLCAGWGLGILLAAPYLMPVVEYSGSGYRASKRAGGVEERPPVGLDALPQLALPGVYGISELGSYSSFPKRQGNLQESVAGGYAGMLALLLASPLAWSNRRHRPAVVFWTVMAAFGLAWSLNIPVVVQLLRLPGLNMMSHNRLVFVTALGVLALTAAGLENLLCGRVKWHKGHWIPLLVMGVVLTFCAYRAVRLPEPLGSKLEERLRSGSILSQIRTPDDLSNAKTWFVRYYTWSTILAAVGVAGWLAIRFRPASHSRLFPLLAAAVVGDLLVFAYGRNPQCDPSLYFPEIPALRALADASPGRVIGYHCLPAKLAQAVGLSDIRGYDSVDPQEVMDVLLPTAERASTFVQYALVQWLAPRLETVPPGAVRLPPVLDMLGVLYVVFRGTPPDSIQAFARSEDYWVMENPRALPRVYVPRRVTVEVNHAERLKRIKAADFDPREVACLEAPVDLSAECRGNAAIVADLPSRVTISITMDTPGLVVLADRWDKDWKATLNGKPVPVLRTNHLLRGVIVPSGAATVEFRYKPSSFAVGLASSVLAAAVLILWATVGQRRARIGVQRR